MTWRNLPTKLLLSKTAIRIVTSNVRTMYETGKAAQVAREMGRYKVKILGLSEHGRKDNSSFRRNSTTLLVT